MFRTVLSGTNTVLNGTELTKKEFVNAIQSLKNDRGQDFNELHVNVIKSVDNEIKIPLTGTPLILDHFPKQRKLPRLHQSSKGVNIHISAISVLPCLSKILERIMYNRLYSQFDQKKTLYGKELGFRAHQSTNHALVELVDSIFGLFNERKHKISTFGNLSKVFGTVDHNILIKKMVFQKTT